jgi:hypothetical protein
MNEDREVNVGKRLSLIISCGLVAVLLAVGAWRYRVLTAQTKLIVSKETTSILGPVFPDGTVDYEAALNQLLSAGISPKENAAVLLDQAFTPDFESIESRNRFYVYLGAPEPRRTDCLISESEFATRKWGGWSGNNERHKRFLEQVMTCQTKAWARIESADVAEWIDSNSAPLKLIEEASRKSQFYTPIVADTVLRDARLSIQNGLRSAFELLRARIMLRIFEGKLEESALDLLTCYHLARLAGKQSFLSAHYFGFARETQCFSSTQELLAAKLPKQLARAMLEKLAVFDELANVAETLNQSERLVLLDILQREWQTGENLTFPRDFPTDLSKHDINIILRRANVHIDQHVLALRNPHLKDRKKAIEAVTAEFNDRIRKWATPVQFFTSMMLESRKLISEKVTDLYLRSEHRAPWAQPEKDRTITRFELVKIGFALAAFRADHDEYPAALQSLIPDYVKAIPLDPYSDQPLHYQRFPDEKSVEQGFLLYSIGEDGRDDGGIVPADGRAPDLVLRVVHTPRPPMIP